MAAITNGTPRAILRGLQDLSGRIVPPEREEIPIHLPKIMLMAAWGPETMQLLGGAEARTMYGDETFDLRSQFANHQTVLHNVIAARANKTMIKRIVPDDAKKARVQLALDYSTATVPAYERDVATGKFRLDDQGAKIPIDGTDYAGYRLRWVLREISELGAGVPSDSPNSVNIDATPGTVMPVLEFEVPHFGAMGSNLGFRLSAPTTDSAEALDMDLAEAAQATIFRMQYVTRPDALASASAIVAETGEQFVDFALKAGVIDKYDI
ncbi:hypothetical protein, partial [Endozoicomonas sp. ONNA1]|uniref:hypothetical protein n=1 Tax=Endozoicomonas sp. ONNA1 TaxID=2828740 RepID=UPI0021493E0A